jgi:hypothetical protein
MFKYLKAAFWVRPQIQGLGAIPINAIAVVCFAILGFGNIGFWLLGFGLEAAFLFGLGLNTRFQQVIDAQEQYRTADSAEDKRRQLIDRLDPSSQKRLQEIQTKCNRILGLYRDAQADQFVIDNSADALQKLQWVYLKLLIAKHNIQANDLQTSADQLKGEIDECKKDLQQPDISDALKESKTATLNILNKRLDNLQKKDQYLEELDSDLTRVEAQVDLALENTTLQGRPAAISTNVELASHLLDDGFYGDSQSDISELDAQIMSNKEVKQ